MAEFEVVEVVPNEAEAELLCSLLRSAGIECMHRQTNWGAGTLDGLPGGAQEIIVAPENAASAREVLEQR
jgi:hypothetical protein